MAATAGPTQPWPLSCGSGSPLVKQLLNRKALRGRPYYLVRWQGSLSADDLRAQAEHLAAESRSSRNLNGVASASLLLSYAAGELPARVPGRANGPWTRVCRV